MPTPASHCTPVLSSWLRTAILMCDGTLSVEFKNGFCCNYLRSTAAYYYMLITAPRPGHWLRQNLYRILPYRRIRLPCPPAGCIATTCCPATSLPSLLHGTFTGSGLFDGTYPFNFDAATTAWLAQSTIGTCNLGLRLHCNPGTNLFQLEYDTILGWVPASTTGLTLVCSPFDLVFATVGLGTCGSISSFRAEFTQ